MNVTEVKAYIDSLPLNISGRFIRPVVRRVREIVPYFMAVIYTPLAGIFWVLRIRLPDFFLDRIGHLLVEPDCFIKEHLLTIGRFPKAMMLAPRGKTANQAAAKYWSKYFVVIENPILVKLLSPLQSHLWTKFSTRRYVVAMYQTADAYRINADWGDRPPLLKLEQSDIDRGQEVLRLMGVPEGAWYVCVHAREGLYSPHDEHWHSFRNTPIADLEKAIAYIVAQGGFCIRMGDSTMRPAPNFPGLFDYALSPYKQDWMDLFLSATCKFLLGSNSGAYQMATVLGRPSALVNMAPLSAIATGVNDIVIPMLYKQGAQGPALSFKQIFNSSYADFRLTEEFEAEGIVLVRNTPEEILDLAVEQLQRVRGTYATDADDELRQAQFKVLLQPGHHSYGAASRIGNAFLRKYQHLLDDSGQ